METSHNKNSALEKIAVLWAQGQKAEAAETIRDLLEDDPKDPILWRDLSTVLLEFKQYAAAAACSKRAIELHQYDPVSLLNHANALSMMGRWTEALDSFSAAARHEPDNLFTCLFYAIALSFYGREEESLEHFGAALVLQPDNIEAQWNYSDTLLRMGRFREGWPGFETRWKRGIGYQQETVYPCPRWKGEDLTGKTILVYEEQGFGDTILSSRYLPLVKARGGKVIFLLARRSLRRLFQSLPGVDRMIAEDDTKEIFDYYIPIMSLPGIFDTELSSIPPASPLQIPPAPSTEIQRLLNIAQDRFKVGIVWSGNPQFPQNNLRAVALERFLQLAEIPGVQLYSLQKGPGEKELRDAGAQGLVIDLGPHLNDFADTAAALNGLDLVIMTDSSVAHLAGTIGRPVWNLLAYHAYWVYLTERSDSPWYPSMRLIRQPAPGDWDAVFKKTAVELAKAVGQKKEGKWP